MSSASRGRYQSRLFNFVHKQSRRLTQQCERAFRELQVATSWVAPVVLYPIYLLFRSTRVAVKQVHQSVQKNWPQLQADDTDSQPQTPPTVDTPIQRVLLLVDALPLSGVRSQESGVRELLAGEQGSRGAGGAGGAGGAEGDCSDRLSVCTLSPSFPSFPSFPSSPSPHHPITPSPPNRNRRVVRGIATQLSSRTLVLITVENEILDILTPQQQQKLQEQIIGEVADYWRYQRLAHSAPLHLPTNQDLPYESDWTRGRGDKATRGAALVILDRAVADLESNYLAPVSEAAIAFGKSSWQLVQQVQSQLTVSRKSPAIALDDSDTHTFRIQALIWAAVNHFFGYRGGRQLKQTTPTTNSLDLPGDSKPSGKPLPHSRSASKLPASFVSSRPQSISPAEDPWLTLGDLFGEPESSLEASTQSQTTTLPTSYSPLPKSPQRDRKSESHQRRSQSTQIDPAPSWIETHATAMGYVKHPLEQLLAWLDRAMLWLEDVLMIIWGRVQQLWRGK